MPITVVNQVELEPDWFANSKQRISFSVRLAYDFTFGNGDPDPLYNQYEAADFLSVLLELSGVTSYCAYRVYKDVESRQARLKRVNGNTWLRPGIPGDIIGSRDPGTSKLYRDWLDTRDPIFCRELSGFGQQLPVGDEQMSSPDRPHVVYLQQGAGTLPAHVPQEAGITALLSFDKQAFFSGPYDSIVIYDNIYARLVELFKSRDKYSSSLDQGLACLAKCWWSRLPEVEQTIWECGLGTIVFNCDELGVLGKLGLSKKQIVAAACDVIQGALIQSTVILPFVRVDDTTNDNAPDPEYMSFGEFGADGISIETYPADGPALHFERPLAPNGYYRESYAARTHTPRAFAIDPTSLLDVDKGYFKTPAGDPAIFARRKRIIETQAASQLWSMEAVLTLDVLALPVEVGVPIDTLLRRLAFQFGAAINSALDSVHLAIFGTWLENKPPVDGSAQRAGSLLSLLVNQIRAAADGLADTDPPPDRKIIEALRTLLIRQLPLSLPLADYAPALAALTGWSKPFAPATDTGILADLVELASNGTTFDTLKLTFASRHLGLDPNAPASAFDQIDPSSLDAIRDAAMVEIGELADLLQSEQGIERVVWNMVLRASRKPQTASDDEKLEAVGQLLRDALWTAPPIDSQKAMVAALRMFKDALDHAFNGAEAVRQATGAVFAVNLVQIPKSVFLQSVPEDAFTERLRDSAFFSRRFSLSGNGGSLEALQGALRPGNSAPLNSDVIERDAIRGALDEALGRIVNTLEADAQGQRFIPDSAPGPLPITIAIDHDVSDLDDFANRYNGVGLVLRRTFWDGATRIEDSWAHAGIAKVKLADGAVPPAGALSDPWPSVLPQRTAEVDGCRQLHLEYEGLPFAYAGFEEVARPDDPVSKQPTQVPFVTTDSPDPGDWKTKPWLDFSKLPSLAYGCRYTAVGHIVTKAGVLPEALRRDDPAPPWMPDATPFETADLDEAFQQRFDYFRRTAIGRTSIVEPIPGRERIGAGIDDVQPLARDYPRIGTAVLSGARIITFLDLLRGPDGLGTCRLPLSVDEETDIDLSDLAWWGAPGGFQIEVFSEHDAGVASSGVQTVFKHDAKVSFAGVGLRFHVTRFEDEITGWMYKFTPSLLPDSAPLPDADLTPVDVGSENIVDDGKRIWLRLRAVSSGSSAISLADPALHRGSASESARGGDPLLLIADKADQAAASGDLWRPEISAPVNAVVTMPRVGFLDFMRWFNNPVLRKKIDDGLRARLLQIYTGRHRDIEVSKAVERMPDPAVAKLRIELTPLDGLTNEPGKMAQTYVPFAVEIDMPGLDKVSADFSAALGAMKGVKHDAVAASYLDLLGLMSRRYEFDLRVSSTGSVFSVTATPDKKGRNLVEVIVPAGMVARLDIRPMVDHTLIDRRGTGLAPFDQRMRQLAVGARAGFYLFDGAAIKIEAALGELTDRKLDEAWKSLPADWRELAAKVVETRPAGTSRRYDLVVDAKLVGKAPHAWKWRQIGSAELRTQRWQFSGRPIYRWLDPSGSAGKSGSGGMIRRVRFGEEGLTLSNFELEAFFDRDDEDADRRSMIVTPLPADAVLQTFEWEKPSATMFRHRLTVRSRYAGAMEPRSIRAVNCWISADDEQKGTLTPDMPESWIRAVVLGDASRIELSRPPLRAVIPLTQPVTRSLMAGSRTPPPLLAILEERPFNFGGLADRIGFEIATGIGYNFPTPAQLEAHDTRREVGPDGRLVYRALEENDAYGMTVVPEGPIGLTFDRGASPKPTFVNAAVVLHPHNMLRADGSIPQGLEEHFLALAMRRFLDRRWLAGEQTALMGGASVEASRGWWIELPIRALSLSHRPKTGRDLYVLKIKQDDLKWSIEVYREAIDPTVAPGTDSIPFCGALKAHAETLALLHVPLEDGRFSISVFALPSRRGDVRSGLGNLPQLLASIDWSAGRGVAPGGLIVSADGSTAYPIAASPITTRMWTRTSRDFDAIVARTELGTTTSLGADAIALSFDKAKMTFVEKGWSSKLWLRSPADVESTAPRYLHRHLIALVTRALKGPGRTVEQFAGAHALVGNAIELPKAPDPDDELLVRIIETESIAAIVHCGSKAVSTRLQLQQLSTAYFDLRAIGREGSKLGNLGFFIRFAATASRRRSIGSVKISIGLPADVGDADGKYDLATLVADTTPAIDCKCKAAAPGPGQQDKDERPVPEVGIQGIVLELKHDISVKPEVFTWEARTLMDNGELFPPVAFPNLTNVTPDQVGEGLLMAVEEVGGGDELWADISMLSGSHLAFDFNWLFSSTIADPLSALRPDAMADATEVQARIVAISPPITGQQAPGKLLSQLGDDGGEQEGEEGEPRVAEPA